MMLLVLALPYIVNCSYILYKLEQQFEILR